MRYYVPDIRSAEELPPQQSFEEKLGGIPWGLPADQWPFCRQCYRPQTLLAQFRHELPRLDLGKAGRIISIFQCENGTGTCHTWEGGSGANACLISEPDGLIDAMTPVPHDSVPLGREVRIVDWIGRNDRVAQYSYGDYFLEVRYLALGREGWLKPASATKLGSVPGWIQGPNGMPEGDWRFLGQLDSFYSFYKAPAVPLRHVTADPHHWEGRTHMAQGPSFGGGVAYVFFREVEGAPEGWMVWQR